MLGRVGSLTCTKSCVVIECTRLSRLTYGYLGRTLGGLRRISVIVAMGHALACGTGLRG